MIPDNQILRCISVVNKLNEKYVEEDAPKSFAPFSFTHSAYSQFIQVFDEYIWNSECEGDTFYDSELEDTDEPLEGSEFEKKLIAHCEEEYFILLNALSSAYLKGIKREDPGTKKAEDIECIDADFRLDMVSMVKGGRSEQ